MREVAVEDYVRFVGPNSALEVFGIKLSGLLAWLLWRGFYLSFLPGFASKVRVLVNWMLNAFVPPNIVLAYSPSGIMSAYEWIRQVMATEKADFFTAHDPDAYKAMKKAPEFYD